MQMWRNCRERGLGVAVALLGVVFLGAESARAGVGLAVNFDLPKAVLVGQTGVSGSLTITHTSTPPEAEGSANVSDITLTLSCGSRAQGAACPYGSETPAVFSVDAVATGRAGTACGGTTFLATVIDAPAGEVAFDPLEGAVTLGPANSGPGQNQCTIDFTFNVNALPAQDALSGSVGGSSARTTAYAGAAASAVDRDRSGFGANWRTWVVTQ